MIKLVNLLELGINPTYNITADLIEELKGEYAMYDLTLTYKGELYKFVGYKEDELMRCPLDTFMQEFENILKKFKILRFFL